LTNTLGNIFKITGFGESHGKSIGVVVDGCPAGFPLDLKQVQAELNRRRPGQSDITTTREEKDKVEIVSGFFNGKTTGAPICMIISNLDKDSSKYEELKWTPRPGHADYPAQIRYKGYNDYRGGGMFSGRITAIHVMGGAIAKQLLQTLNIDIICFTRAIGSISMQDKVFTGLRNKIESNDVRCPDMEAAEKMIKEIENAKNEGDSLGGIVECIAHNIPAGLGQPVFDTLDGDLSKAFFSIPAVKAVVFGEGLLAASMRGSENNDPYILADNNIITESNNSGGILGGMSNGMPIRCRLYFKPTPSISKKQKTIDLRTGKQTFIEIKGRHDPCIVPRAVPVVESVVALVLIDHALRAGLIPQALEEKNELQ
jgi:chorismate synthase